MWEIEYTDQFAEWWSEHLTLVEQGAIELALQALQVQGPMLGRPLVDTLKGSRHANMKELRPPGETIRILFDFDPRRTAILLLGGDKRNRWSAWYREMVPIADQLYDEHLAALRREGELS
ncbi:MAG: type II toxin-antitoxin system RelE/ParE family toxin [Dehalococcoidia bacterium]